MIELKWSCEWASLFGHDINGQHHVLGFIVGELLGKDAKDATSEKLEKFTQTSKTALDNLNQMSLFYRRVHKNLSALDFEEIPMKTAMSLADDLRSLYFFQKRSRLEVEGYSTLQGEGLVSADLWAICSLFFFLAESTLDTRQQPLALQWSEAGNQSWHADVEGQLPRLEDLINFDARENFAGGKLEFRKSLAEYLDQLLASKLSLSIEYNSNDNFITLERNR